MEVTDVKFRKKRDYHPPWVIANVCVSLDDTLVLYDMRLVKERDGTLKIHFPEWPKMKYKVYFPYGYELRKEIEDAIISKAG